MKPGWQIKPLGAVCDLVNGGTPKTGVPEYWGGDNLWITPAEMGGRANPYVSDTERKITELGLRESSARLLPINSVILSSRAPIGHLVVNTKPMATNQGCKGLIPGKELHYKYLYYYLNSVVDLLNDLGTGATFKELSVGKLKEVPISFPDILEQERIVGILSRASDGICAAIENVEDNIQNCRSLFESNLRASFSGGDKWEVRKLGDCCIRITDGIHNSPAYVEAGIPILDSKHIKDDFVIDDTKPEKFISKITDALLAKRCKPQAGDILISSRGSIGKIAIVREDQNFNIMGNIILIRLPLEISREFVAFYLRSQIPKIVSLAQGVAQKGLYLGQVREFDLPVPAAEEQRQITERLKSLFIFTQTLENIYKRKLAALDELKKSLLHQAFSGNL